MKLSRKSILYRSAEFNSQLLRYSIFRRSHNFCDFFWHYISVLIQNIVLSLGIGFIITSMLLDAILYFSIENFDPSFSILTIFGAALWMFITLFGGIAICFVIIYGIIIFIKDKFAIRKYDDNGEEVLGVIRTYLKARKDKYCPTLEIIE